MIAPQVFIGDILISFTRDLNLLEMHKPYLLPFQKGLWMSTLTAQRDKLFIQADQQGLKQLWKFADQLFKTKPQTITVSLKEDINYSKLVQQHFKVIYAAGGVVKKDQQILMIYRLHKWDLPKGKIELGELSGITAVREVAEECGVKALLGKKIGVTHHTYMEHEIPILKKTLWYTMDCMQDDQMQPQETEAITKVAWLDAEAVKSALNNSYASIRYVLDLYQNRMI